MHWASDQPGRKMGGLEVASNFALHLRPLPRHCVGRYVVLHILHTREHVETSRLGRWAGDRSSGLSPLAASSELLMGEKVRKSQNSSTYEYPYWQNCAEK